MPISSALLEGRPTRKRSLMASTLPPVCAPGGGNSGDALGGGGGGGSGGGGGGGCGGDGGGGDRRGSGLGGGLGGGGGEGGGGGGSDGEGGGRGSGDGGGGGEGGGSDGGGGGCGDENSKLDTSSSSTSPSSIPMPGANSANMASARKPTPKTSHAHQGTPWARRCRRGFEVPCFLRPLLALRLEASRTDWVSLYPISSSERSSAGASAT